MRRIAQHALTPILTALLATAAAAPAAQAEGLLRSIPGCELILRGYNQISAAFDMHKLRKEFEGRPASELRAIYEQQLPAARGTVDASFEQVMRAHRIIKAAAEKLGGVPARTSSATPRTEARDILLHEPIAGIETFAAGGFNTSYLVTFQNGKRAIFKPFFGQHNLNYPRPDWRFRIAFPREVTAVPIIEEFLGNASSRAKGLSPIELPATEETALVFNGISYGLGSIQMFVEGFESSKDRLQAEAWPGLPERVRTIDYLIGNPDRLSNYGIGIARYEQPNYSNLLLDQSSRGQGLGRVTLIDNAFGRPGRTGFGRQYAPAANRIPPDLAHAILNFDETKFRTTFRTQLPEEGLQDFINRIQTLQKELRP